MFGVDKNSDLPAACLEIYDVVDDPASGELLLVLFVHEYARGCICSDGDEIYLSFETLMLGMNITASECFDSG